jgi:hypothetical protein
MQIGIVINDFNNNFKFEFTANALLPIIQKWGAIHWPKSLWDLKNEIDSLHLNDFNLIKVISL